VFAKSTLPTSVQTKLNQSFGKPSLKHCFKSQAASRHILLPVIKSGFLSPADLEEFYSWSNDGRVVGELLAEFQDVDFSALQGYPEGWEDETEVNHDRIRMATAALLHFDGDVSSVVRWVGGIHVGEHYKREERLKELRPMLPAELYKDLERIFNLGIPGQLNAESTEENFQAFRQYGNHKSLAADPQFLHENIVKGFKRSYFLGFDRRMIHFALNCHQTPHGIVSPDSKDSRLTCDASFRPNVNAHAVNDWVDMQATEPTLTFMTSPMRFMVWVYNARITYPNEEVLVGDDDVSGAFRLLKNHPDLVAMLSFVALDLMLCYTSGPFGVNWTPSNWDVLAQARQRAAQYFWIHEPDETIEMMREFMESMQTMPPATPEEAAQFTRAEPDSINKGVLDSNGERRPPEFCMWVDDNVYADIAKFMRLTVACSFRALYTVFGLPIPRIAPDTISHGQKLTMVYTNRRVWIGKEWNLRRLCVGITSEKRAKTVKSLTDVLTATGRDYNLLDIASLHGQLESATEHCSWGRVWFFALQNALRRVVATRTHVVIRQFHAQGRAHELRRALDPQLEKRFAPLVARYQARAVWNSRATMRLSAEVLDGLEKMRRYMSNSDLPWRQQIGYIIPRDAHVISWGDAATTHGGGGAFCPGLELWFDIVWSDRVKQGLLDKTVHINSLEFIVLLLQIMAILERTKTLSDPEREQFFPRGVPAELVILVWIDNTSAKSWANKVTSRSATGQRLIGILSELLRTRNFGFNAEHIAGEDNKTADYISRLCHEFPSHLARIQQLFQKEPALESYHYFRPSPEILSLLSSLLFSEQAPDLPSLPRTLGQLVPTACIFSTSAEI
jgi:hypothetical protein